MRADLVAIPKELISQHQQLELCMDVMYIDGLPMFTSIDRTVKFRSLVPLDATTVEHLYEALDVVL